MLLVVFKANLGYLVRLSQKKSNTIVTKNNDLPPPRKENKIKLSIKQKKKKKKKA